MIIILLMPSHDGFFSVFKTVTLYFSRGYPTIQMSQVTWTPRPLRCWPAGCWSTRSARSSRQPSCPDPRASLTRRLQMVQRRCSVPSGPPANQAKGHC